MRMTACSIVLISFAINCVVRSDDLQDEVNGVAKIRAEAAALQTLVQSRAARTFLEAAELLPAIETRTLWRDKKKREYFSSLQASHLSKDAPDLLEEVTLDESFYYTTKYGTPNGSSSDRSRISSNETPESTLWRFFAEQPPGRLRCRNPFRGNHPSNPCPSQPLMKKFWSSIACTRRSG